MFGHQPFQRGPAIIHSLGTKHHSFGSAVPSFWFPDPRLLAYEPETPCAIDLLVGAVEHLMVTLGVPIWTLGDEMRANEAMLSDAELRQRTWELLQGLHLELQKLQREPKTPDATGFLRSRLLRNHCQWDDYH